MCADHMAKPIDLTGNWIYYVCAFIVKLSTYVPIGKLSQAWFRPTLFVFKPTCDNCEKGYCLLWKKVTPYSIACTMSLGIIFRGGWYLFTLPSFLSLGIKQNKNIMMHPPGISELRRCKFKCCFSQNKIIISTKHTPSFLWSINRQYDSNKVYCKKKELVL